MRTPLTSRCLVAARALAPFCLAVLLMPTAIAQSTDRSIDVSARPTITVQGKGESSAIPDTVYITVGVQTQDPEAGRALTANTEAMNDLMATLKSYQIAEKHIQTVNFSISPQYSNQRRGEDQPKIVAYNVSNQVRIKVPKIENLGRILDAVVQKGANSVYGIQFDVDDPQVTEDQARTNAVKDARRRAEVLAEAAGVKVGRALQISEATFRGGPQPMMARTMAMAESVPIAQGEQQLSANVTIVFELISE